MKAIREAELKGAAQVGLIKSMKIQVTETGGYQIAVEVAHKPGLFQLVTDKKDIRKWASLDRLVNHIRSSYGEIPNITLSITPE